VEREAGEAGREPGESGVRHGPGGRTSGGKERLPPLSLGVLCLAACAACASAGDPPGGPPDEEAPQLVSSTPDSGAVVDRVPGRVDLVFSEVISERVAGTPPTITSAVIVSPSLRETRVAWKRTRLEARPAEGFQPGRVYRVELVPVITDLRQNRMTQGRVIVFSTGPAIPFAVLEGAVADWAGGRPAVRALIEAVLLPDSLPYRTLADSTGWFSMRQMPPGTYLVHGIMDTNGDRRRGTREAYDTVRVELADRALVELYAFVHDTVGPRVRQVEVQDSLTIRLTFDRPIDPSFAFDTALVTLATAEDTTTRLPIEGIYTQAQVDSLRRAAEAARRTARDTAGVEPPPPPPPPPPAAPVRGAPAGRGGPGARPAPLDSTVAQRMLARRPPPTDVRMLRLAQPLEVDVRYVIILHGVRGLTGAESRSRGQIRIPRPRARTPVAPGPGAQEMVPVDPARPDSARVPVAPDTVRADTSAPSPHLFAVPPRR
jgi:hypothetical protein